MNRKLWIVTIVYELFVAIPYSAVIGAVAPNGAWLGFVAFLGLTGSYVTALLLIMGLIDYARGK
jgi:hypothetical protein